MPVYGAQDTAVVKIVIADEFHRAVIGLDRRKGISILLQADRLSKAIHRLRVQHHMPLGRNGPGIPDLSGKSHIIGRGFVYPDAYETIPEIPTVTTFPPARAIVPDSIDQSPVLDRVGNSTKPSNT